MNRSIIDIMESQQLKQMILVEYSLIALEPSKKQRFSHALFGTGGRKSVLKLCQGRKIGKMALLIPPAYEMKLDDFFKVWDVIPKKTKVWLEDEK